MGDNDFPTVMANGGNGVRFLRKYLRGFQSYQQAGTDIPEESFRTDYGQEQGGPIFGETVIAGSPSFDLTVPDIPALGPETPASMRRRQLEMLMPGHETRRRAGEKYNKIFPFPRA